MSKIRLKLANMTAVLSLLLGLGTGVLWTRSYYLDEKLLWIASSGSDRGYGFESALGILTLQRLVLSHPIGPNQSIHESESITSIKRASNRDWMDQESWHGFAWQNIGFAKPSAKLYGTWYELSFPYWFLLLATSVLPCVTVYHKKQSCNMKQDVCIVCGYDLRATPDRCPECGTTVPNSNNLGPP